MILFLTYCTQEVRHDAEVRQPAPVAASPQEELTKAAREYGYDVDAAGRVEVPQSCLDEHHREELLGFIAQLGNGQASVKRMYVCFTEDGATIVGTRITLAPESLPKCNFCFPSLDKHGTQKFVKEAICAMKRARW